MHFVSSTMSEISYLDYLFSCVYIYYIYIFIYSHLVVLEKVYTHLHCVKDKSYFIVSPVYRKIRLYRVGHRSDFQVFRVGLNEEMHKYSEPPNKKCGESTFI